jgi:hypothetical protein
MFGGEMKMDEDELIEIDLSKIILYEPKKLSEKEKFELRIKYIMAYQELLKNK